MFLASENIDFTGLSHVFLLGGGEGGSFFYKKAMQDLKGRPSESEVMNSPVDCSLVRGCWAPGWPTKEKLLP